MSGTPPPTVAESPFRQLAWWVERPIQFLEHCRRRYGDAFMVRFAGAEAPIAFLSHPEAMRALFSDPQLGLMPARRERLAPILGADSVFVLDSGPEHMKRRKLAAPSFHGDRMRLSRQVAREVAEREIRDWPRGEVLSLYPRMQAITLEVIVRAVFGVTEPARSRKLQEMLAKLLTQLARKDIQVRLVLRSLASRPDPVPPSLRRLMDEVDRVLFEEMARCRAEGPETREDVMAQLVAARFEDGSTLSDRGVRNQLMALLLAGSETSAVSLSWTFDIVLRRPDVMSRLTDPDGDEAYLQAVVWESLRLRPVIMFAGRRLTSELQAGEHTLPAGCDAVAVPWLTHTRPDLYPEPSAFRPERFLDRKPDTYAWIPFGGGVRRCMGAAFAEAEIQVVLDTILRGIDLRPASPRPEPRKRRNMTVSPLRGTLVRAGVRPPRSRQAAAARAEGVDG
jgi:cytochrome P450